MYRDEELLVNDEVGTCDDTQTSYLVEVCVEAREVQSPKKKTEKYDDQIDTIGQILEKECDEHDHISPFLTAKMRRVPLRLREEMQMELLQIVSKYINYAWN